MIQLYKAYSIWPTEDNNDVFRLEWRMGRTIKNAIQFDKIPAYFKDYPPWPDPKIIMTMDERNEREKEFDSQWAYQRLNGLLTEEEVDFLKEIHNVMNEDSEGEYRFSFHYELVKFPINLVDLFYLGENPENSSNIDRRVMLFGGDLTNENGDWFTGMTLHFPLESKTVEEFLKKIKE